MSSIQRKMVILYSIGGLQIGGAEGQLLMLACEMRKLGHEVHLFVVDGRGPLKSRFEQAGIIVHPGGFHGGGSRAKRLLRLVRAQLRLVALARHLRPDVVHGFLPLTNFMIALAGALNRVPRIVTSRRALGTHQDRHRFWAPMDRLANWMSDDITANSRAVARDAILRDAADPAKIVVIYNGIDLPPLEVDVRDKVRRELGLAPEDKAVVSVANLIPYKGHAEMIEAMALTAGDLPGLRLFLIGEDRGIGDSLNARIAELHLQDRVFLMGQRRDVPQLLAGMDIGLMASHEEGFSNALLEMLHAGLPVIATRVGGNVEAVEGIAGCQLIAPNSPDDIAAALSRAFGLTRTPEERLEQVDAIRQKYAPQTMRDHYLALYAGQMSICSDR